MESWRVYQYRLVMSKRKKMAWMRRKQIMVDTLFFAIHAVLLFGALSIICAHI